MTVLHSWLRGKCGGMRSGHRFHSQLYIAVALL